jgi:hypothetical protein
MNWAAPRMFQRQPTRIAPVVTNTTTASVPSTRAGMASGIDMSARLISLAVNIAMMGFVLVNGILAYLKTIVPGSAYPADLRPLAEKIAAGDLVSFDQSFPGHIFGSGEVIRAALTHGFGLVMLYGGVGVWVLAAASFIIFWSEEIPFRNQRVGQPASSRYGHLPINSNRKT